MEQQNSMEKRNLILAIVFSAILLFAVDAIFPQAESPKTIKAPEVVSSAPVAASADSQPIAAATAPVSVAQAVNENAHLTIETPSVKGSLRLKGARFDNLSLLKYRETLDENSPHITLFSPVGTAFPFFAEFGWISNEFGLPLPNAQTVWSTADEKLTPETPVTLTWDNQAGLKFIRQIAVDENYMFTVTDRVENYADRAFTLFNYGLVGRTNVPPSQRGAVLEGLIGFADGGLKEYAYDKIAKDKQASYDTTGGWAGITDKYWMGVLAFDQNLQNVNIRFSENDSAEGKHFQADYRLPPMMIQAGQAVQTTARLFAGAKELKLIDAYEKDLGIKRFDLTVDFGWYYFLTKPFFFILSWLNSLLGNMGLAILMFAFLLRLAMYPIANKSYVNMNKMKDLQPRIDALREKYGDDKVSFNQAVMNLYRDEKINPASGCLPMLIQIPVFFSLYKVLYISLELRQAPFYGWIRDLSAPDPSSVFTLFGLVNWPVPDMINIGVWPVIMGLTMWIQQQMSPKAGDKTQSAVLGLMPWFMMFLLGHLASGLVIYWSWSNLLSIAQQKAIRRQGKK